MFNDNKSAGQWEVVGGKAGAKQGKGNKSPNAGAGSGKKSKPSAPTLKVDELGMYMHHLRLYTLNNLHAYMAGLISVTPLDTKYALLDPEMRAQAKREALGIAPPAAANKPAKSNAAAKEAAKKKPSKESNKENKEKSVKSLPEALKQVLHCTSTSCLILLKLVPNICL